MLLHTKELSAFFTNKQKITNQFTIGEITIAVEEPNWDSNNSKNLNPGDVVKKDPLIKNTTVQSPVYVFFKVDIPKSLNTSQTEIFSYKINPGWLELEDKKITTDPNQNTHIYAYATDINTMKLLSENESTPSLFDEVTLTSNASLLIGKSTVNITLSGYAIQTDNLRNAKTPSEIYNLLSNV